MMTRLSLRTRLVAVVVAVTIFALTAGGAATWLSLRAYLYHRVDGNLQDMANGREQDFNRWTDSDGDISIPPNKEYLLYGGPGPGGPGGQQTILRPDGSVVKVGLASDTSIVLDDIFFALSKSDANTLIGHTSTPYNVTEAGGTDLRAESRTLANGLTLVVALPLGDVNNTLARLLLVELAVSGAAVLAVVGLGAYGVRIGLHPLTHVSNTAHEIAENLKRDGSGLERRVPPGDPRTEVGQLTEAVNTMLSEAQVAYAQRVENEDRMRRFLADASHELRTPLTSLRGYAELERLRAGTVGAEDPAATQDALRRIETEGDRMARLVDDLLLLARTDQGSSAPELGPVPVDELLDEAADRAGAAHPSRPFVIDTPNTGLMLVGDREALLQVLGNLIRNAAIHTPGPRPIRLGARPDGSTVLLLVADEGPGMSPEQADHAFERFWRADSGRTRATGGSGLGLAIVHALVAAQHGTVGLTSDVATGTTALVRMPGLLDDTGRLVHRPTPDYYPQQYTDPDTGAYRSVGTPDYRRLP
ncbi:sensor histidine kinase [Cryptosporangium arvum]|uniref:sensor histidine kinase n=1 Tax=Cryptosporangium arvum TaxID=80871 RepID=UPI0004AF8CAA|nr:ATP-binding protein [Cryptosporangium arvum]